MLTDGKLEQILQRIPHLMMGVVGDLFLDRYLDVDATLTEPSIETGLDAYQVVRVRSYPGAAGTVINNLAALGVGRILPVSVIGDDGEGYELRQALAALPAVVPEHVISRPDRRTPTYTKPMLNESGRPPRELNRLDIKNRARLAKEAEVAVGKALIDAFPRADALLVLDQVSEPECGVVTTHLRGLLTVLGRASPEKLILADSRERIGMFRHVCTKPNFAECRRAVRGPDDAKVCAGKLARRTGRPAFCTLSERGIVVADARDNPPRLAEVPAYSVTGPIDPVGAGDSTSAGIACALAAGASLEEAAAFGNLVASITVQQIGTTGTATPEQVRQRWGEVRS
jgi:bifunctional ADP-heptose synthase (sugar kinase/adenylyltransferase)